MLRVRAELPGPVPLVCRWRVCTSGPPPDDVPRSIRRDASQTLSAPRRFLRQMPCHDIVCTMSNNTEHIAHKTVPRGRPAQDALYAVAESQAGYFTTAQASSAGYSRSLVYHHAKAGTFAKARSGVYRLSRFPASPWEDLFVAWLQAGPEAVVSHDSALALFELSDAMPSEMHFTLPRTSSHRRPHIRMHTSALAREDVVMREGLPVTSVARTIADVARAGTSQGIVDQAITQSLERGLASESLLRDRAERGGGRARRLILSALDRRSDR